MAAADLSGHWKGLAVARHAHAVVHIYLEHNGTEIHGKFESPELPGPNSKGDLTGSLQGGAITLQVPGKMTFRGQVVGENHMIYGLMQAADETQAGGTLTLFPGLPTEMPLMYKMANQDE